MEDHAQAADGCKLPPELDDLALIAAIDGEAETEVLAHLRACPHCAARAHRFADLQGLLRKQLFRIFCPSSETLVAFQQGVLASDQRATLEAHLEDCPHCSREQRLLLQLVGDPLSSRSPPLGALFNTSVGGMIVGKLRQVFAELLPAPAIELAGAYGRLRGPAQMAQYAYHAENLQINIGVRRVAQHAERRVVVGSVEIEDEDLVAFEAATASLLRHDVPISTAEIDDLGNFVLDNLMPGTYRLSLRLPDREVVIEALSL
jgi:hypothetical protein